MRDKELWLNGSGYPDPTAYEAMKGMENMNGKVGEIWEVNTHKGTKTVLVVAEKNGVFALLDVKDVKTEFTDIEFVLNHSLWYTNSAMMRYCFENRFIEKDGTLSDDEFTKVLETIGRTFDVPMMPVTEFVKAAHDNTLEKNAEIDKLNDQLSQCIEAIQVKDDEIERLKAELNEIKDAPIFPEDYDFHDATVLKTERDLYKQLYEQAFERLIAR